MLFRPLLALVLAFCLTFVAAPSSVSAAISSGAGNSDFVVGPERSNARFGGIVNTGRANDCPTVAAGSNGSISIGSGDTLSDICLHPTEVFVKLSASKRKKS